MREVDALQAIEDIKVLKARYFRSLDTQDWDLMGQVFADDVVCDFRGSTVDPASGFNPAPEATDNVLRGKDAAIAAIAASMAGVRSIHHGHMPEISVTGPDSATGIWAMFDNLRMQKGPARELTGYGHYHEIYVRTQAGWRIAEVRLTRLRIDYIMAS